MSKKVIVIGGNAAGLSAASQIKRTNPAWETIVIEKTDEVSYAGCGIPYYIQGKIKDHEDLFALKQDVITEKRNIDLRLHAEVKSVNPQDNSLKYTKDGQAIEESFDYLVIASGASPSNKGIKVESGNVFTVRNVADGKKIREYINEKDIRKVGVVGGGYIALEMAEVLSQMNLDTTLIHRRDQLNRAFEEEISKDILGILKDNNVNLELNTEIDKVEEKSNDMNKAVAVPKEGEPLEFDLIILAMGVAPNTEFLKDSGIELGVSNTIKVSRYLKTNYDNIYAAGDVVETVDLITGEPVFSPLALKANKEGSIAGTNIASESDIEEFPGIAKSSILKIFNYGVAMTGLTHHEALQNGFEAETIVVESRTKPHYYPGSDNIKILVNFDSKSGRILGAQILGPIDEAKKIDVYTCMIQLNGTIKDLYNLDLAYAPPFSPVYDPIVLSGRVGKKKVKG
ncbi:FAD-dependent oxidoreductase [Natranaerofaba carboxydovora]|uniref:FAD-dependent oxidoreductase n=1 Tax=Natranaerofaba carboxydovora TaxID=2742683 RepID=UPI001F133178|nr:FAD-dependent oxidoreductase [Natranaerofaba carboxydovora]UMZ75147.1 Coenzyme A disulfide reductase [Natranaerofaba carboxydovora]